MNWIETTEERYHDMLGCVPPASMCGSAFQVGEASNHVNGRPTFATFRVTDGPDGTRYWESAQPMTYREFKVEYPEAEYYYS